MSGETLTEWMRNKHTNEMERGLHDDQCEWRSTGFYLCHCSKRRREADGLTAPLDDIYFPPPMCPSCDCEYCRTTWDMDGTHAKFIDVYSDDLAADVVEWERTHK